MSGSAAKRRSAGGLVLQCVGAVTPPVAFVWRGSAAGDVGTVRIAVAVVIAAGAIGLFLWALRSLGRHWSVVARAGEGHRLVTCGPYRWMRNPMYAAVGGVVLALVVAFGDVASSGVAILALLFGTGLRVRAEEAVLRARHGEGFDEYARTVKAWGRF